MSEPLSDLEYEQLDQFLQSDLVGRGAMDVSMLDGFLTAILMGPRAQALDRCLPLVWACPEPRWDDEAQAKLVHSWVTRHMNAVAQALAKEREAFEPLLSFRYDGVQEITVLDDWCQGFVTGVELDAEGWRPLLEDDESEALLFPIMLHGTQAGWRTLEQQPELRARHGEFVEQLPADVLGIYDFWLNYRRVVAGTHTLRREQALPGRNDPCSCGSGKKFKKCCGV